MKKPYLISLASYTPGVERYLRSMERLEDSVEPVFVDFSPHTPVEKLGYLQQFSRYWYHRNPKTYPGHYFRWKYLPENLEEDRWWIFTDTHDVVFQGPISNLDDYGPEVLLSYEGMKHRDNGFWDTYISANLPKEIKYDRLLDSPVYNVGTWAAKGRVMKSFQKYILTESTPDVWDQIPFNVWLVDQSYISAPDLFATLFNHWYETRLVKVHGIYSWLDDIIPAIVHGNGSSKELL